MKNPAHVEERHEAEREKCLRRNGWTYGMWRCFWVWRKEVHDATFVCVTAEQALSTERAIQETAEIYPPPTPGVTASADHTFSQQTPPKDGKC